MTAVDDRTPELAECADAEPAGWTEADMEAWSNELAGDEWRDAQLLRPSDVLAAEWGPRWPADQLR